MPSAEHRLGLRTLYIIPSRFGMVWLAAAALLLLVAIQTGSNSTLLIAFLLLGLMLLVDLGRESCTEVRGLLGPDGRVLIVHFVGRRCCETQNQGRHARGR